MQKRQHMSFGSSSETDFGPSGGDFNRCVVCGHERWIHMIHPRAICEGHADNRRVWCSCSKYHWRIWRWFHKKKCAELKAAIRPVEL